MKMLPKIAAMLVLWAVVAGIIVYIEPEVVRNVILPNSYSPLVLATGAAVWYTTAALLGRIGRGLLMAILAMTALTLSINGFMYPFLAAVFLAVAVIIATLRLDGGKHR